MTLRGCGLQYAARSPLLTVGTSSGPRNFTRAERLGVILRSAPMLVLALE